MNILWSIVNDAANEAVPAMMSAMWQGTVLVLVLWGLLKPAKALNATTKGLIWWVALLVVSALPFLNWIVSKDRLLTATQIQDGSTTQIPIPPPDGLQTTAANIPPSDFNLPDPLATASTRPTAATAIVPSLTSSPSITEIEAAASNSRPAQRRWELTTGFLPSLALMAWSMCAAYLTLRLIVGLWKLNELKHKSTIAPIEMQNDFDTWLGKMQIRHPVLLCLSTHIHTPSAAGLNNPMVLLPTSLPQQLEKAELDAVIVHELAHFRRGDDWSNLAQQILQAIHCFNPAIWIIGRQITLQREIACDDWVIGSVSQPKAYASCLAHLMEMAIPLPKNLPAPGAWLSKGQMHSRVIALLDNQRNIATYQSPTQTALGAFAILLLVVGALHFGPSITFANASPYGGRMAVQKPKPELSKKVNEASIAFEQKKAQERKLLQEEVTLLEQLVAALQAKEKPTEDSKIDLLKAQRDLVALKRQLIALNVEAGLSEIPRLEKAVQQGDKFQATHLTEKLEKMLPDEKRIALLKEQTVSLPAKTDLTLDLGGGVKMEFVLIQPGNFIMGSETSYPEERPIRGVTISKPYYLGKYEVTQEQWRRLIDRNPSEFKGSKLPVERISWDECQKFITQLEAKFPQYDFSLPTEAQWEYACRAGNQGNFSFGDDNTRLIEYGWYGSNASDKTHPVGEKKPNAWGLYDMHGNVWEWCEDWFSFYQPGRWTRKIQPIPGTPEYKTFDINEVTDPTGALTGTHRVIRGGSWNNIPNHNRSANRHKYSPESSNWHLGMRCAIIGVSKYASVKP